HSASLSLTPTSTHPTPPPLLDPWISVSVNNITIQEGKLWQGTIATFTDAKPHDASAYYAYVDWGDEGNWYGSWYGYYWYYGYGSNGVLSGRGGSFNAPASPVPRQAG